MKKLFCLLAAMAIMSVFTACKNDNSKKDEQKPDTEVSAAENEADDGMALEEDSTGIPEGGLVDAEPDTDEVVTRGVAKMNLIPVSVHVRKCNGSGGSLCSCKTYKGYKKEGDDSFVGKCSNYAGGHKCGHDPSAHVR